MRGSILSLYAFKIKSAGFTLEELDCELEVGKINKDEHNYLVGYYKRCMLCG